MLNLIISKLSIAVLLIAVAFTPAATIFDVKTQPSKGLVVHEWGTFTSVTTADGQRQVWSPLTGPSDLPGFVYKSKQQTQFSQGNCVKCGWAYVRMETPVLYFYSDRELSASVKVGFPRGSITEWYPQAREVGSGINWMNFTVKPGATANFPVEEAESHYYPARETDAAPLTLGNEQEKFLFYRGIGNFDLPITAKLGNDQVTVKNTGSEALTSVVVFENRGGRVGWRIVNSLGGEAALARPALGQSLDSLRSELQKALTSQGLYEKEAAAMVKTWSDFWFEDGLRIFYVVPRKTTDRILPIAITPAPTELDRVLVGRLEIVTPEMELAIQAAAQKYLEGTAESHAAALKALHPYGRFAEPTLRRLMENAHKIGQAKASQPYWDFMNAALADAGSKR
ncbi:MAG: hypothetical protein JST85_26295 [Acidobacteria bacterium]|nr:hypothetical protein [Acidobacteriota bacterium]